MRSTVIATLFIVGLVNNVYAKRIEVGASGIFMPESPSIGHIEIKKGYKKEEGELVFNMDKGLGLFLRGKLGKNAMGGVSFNYHTQGEGSAIHIGWSLYFGGHLNQVIAMGFVLDTSFYYFQAEVDKNDDLQLIGLSISPRFQIDFTILRGQTSYINLFLSLGVLSVPHSSGEYRTIDINCRFARTMMTVGIALGSN